MRSFRNSPQIRPRHQLRTTAYVPDSAGTADRKMTFRQGEDAGISLAIFPVSAPDIKALPPWQEHCR